MKTITITSIEFREPTVPELADVYYTINGVNTSLNGHIRVTLDDKFRNELVQDIKDVLKKQIEGL